MAKVRSLPLANYPSGSREVGPFTFNNGLAGFDLRIGRCTDADPSIWPNASTVLRIDLQFSYDGGATWTPLGANSWEQGGGIFLDRAGNQVPETALAWRFSPTEPNRMKATLTVTGGPIRTYLDVTIAD